MKSRKLMRLNAALFALVFIGHAARITNGWDMNLGIWAIPMWLSWSAVVIIGYLGWNNYQLSR